MASNNNPDRIALYRRLIENSRDLSSTLDLNELLLKLVNTAVELSESEAAAVSLYEESTHELSNVIASNQVEQTWHNETIPLDSTITGIIVHQRHPIIINEKDIDQQPVEKLGDILKLQIRSMIGVPLVTKQKLVGVLEVANKKKGAYTELDLELIQALAAHGAIAIENARLFLQSDLITELVHELRTPMASLNTAIHLLIHQNSEDQHRQYLETMIQSEIARLSELTTSFLDLARLESGRIQLVQDELDLEQLLMDCTEMMRARAVERNITLNLHFPTQLPPIKADKDKMKQVVINLLSNAIKYNFPGGKIEIQGLTKPDFVGFSIADTGPGISPEDRQHIFEKFYRVPGTEKLASGTGLGLSVCRRIIDAHHGSIQVESTVGQGTRFLVLLPT